MGPGYFPEIYYFITEPGHSINNFREFNGIPPPVSVTSRLNTGFLEIRTKFKTVRRFLSFFQKILTVIIVSLTNCNQQEDDDKLMTKHLTKKFCPIFYVDQISLQNSLFFLNLGFLKHQAQVLSKQSIYKILSLKR